MVLTQCKWTLWGCIFIPCYALVVRYYIFLLAMHMFVFGIFDRFSSKFACELVLGMSPWRLFGCKFKYFLTELLHLAFGLFGPLLSGIS